MSVAGRARRRRSADRSYLSVDWSHPVAGDLINRGLRHWSLSVPNRQQGATLLDLKKTHDGTLTSMASPSTSTSGWQTSTGRPGGFASLRFDGTNDHVLFGDVLDVRTSFGWSWGCWFRNTAPNPNQWRSLMAKSLAGGAMYRWFTIFEGGNLYSLWQDEDGTHTVSVAETAYRDSQWHHAFTTLDRQAGVLTLYVDARQVAQTTWSVIGGGPAMDANTAFVLAFGGYNNGTDGTTITQGYFIGEMDDWRVFERPLLPREVYELYEDSRNGYPRTLRHWGRRTWSVPSAPPSVIVGRGLLDSILLKPKRLVS